MITLAEYAQYAGKTLPLDNENQIAAIIDAVSDIIEGQLDRDLADASPSPVDTIEVFSGRGSFRMWTKNAPIDSIDTIEYWNGTVWEAVADLGMTFAFDAATGKVWFVERYVFHKGVDNWRITYSYGFTSGIPDDLKYACFLLTTYFSQKQSRQDIRSQSDGEQSFTYAVGDDVPKNYTAIIAKYNRPY